MVEMADPCIEFNENDNYRAFLHHRGPFSSLFSALTAATSDEPVAPNGVSEERGLKKVGATLLWPCESEAHARAQASVPFNRRV